jgi:hypothetical protein
MTYVPKRWHRPALFAWGFIGGPLMLINGVRSIERGTTVSTIGGWFMVVGGLLMVVGGGLTFLGLLRRKPSS